ncbi:MAG: hypothetical protein COY42_23750 [Armatimonadetes bacterium CG_4_10_14_0_8_um_filter_66_14]|nr:MAG: hypothetical protein AUJ96_04785 [Armatimonadetes bacterium CG2_30_66_41]PIX45180.1 MAG: hypothetical protein COZ57_16210 [Armatimonadetes bacterium CG_4_8_14_3_um_filter_66_20]PIZ37758.1 MAG: hypothetical protein COY42_23750 [Armatimonadetes bacterium CG_4_10_14_0_8_um_filter_66_14]
MATMIAPVDAGHRVQLPADWATELGLEHLATLEKTTRGIWVRPCQANTWDEVFVDKLAMGPQPSALDLSEVSGDDLIL